MTDLNPPQPDDEEIPLDDELVDDADGDAAKPMPFDESNQPKGG